MVTKLTLSINEETIERAKRISKKRGKSISKMVEEYFNSLPEKNETKETAVYKIKNILKGKNTKADIDWKEVKKEHLKDKYGL